MNEHAENSLGMVIMGIVVITVIGLMTKCVEKRDALEAAKGKASECLQVKP